MPNILYVTEIITIAFSEQRLNLQLLIARENLPEFVVEAAIIVGY